VATYLPGLDAPASAGLALVALAGSPRTEAADALGLPAEQLGEALARARKALRRSLLPLPGSGWCERAERLVSDRLDGVLEPPGPARLEVHLRNCARCVEHERRLVQATDAMVAAFAPGPALAPAPMEAPPLSVVKRSAPVAPSVLPFGEPVRPAPARVPEPSPMLPETMPSAPEPVVSPPLPAPIARGPRAASLVAWNLLLAIAIVLAVAAIAIAVAGALGASL